MESRELYTNHIQINKSDIKGGAETFGVGFEPGNEYLTERGSLYLLFEKLDNKNLDFKKLLSILGESFYNKADVSFEDRFKSALRSLNSQLAQKEATANVVLVATSENKMLFSDIGDAVFLLIRKESTINLSSNSNSRKFKEIGQGKIRPKDKIIILSSNIKQNFKTKDLAIMASKQSANKFMEQLEQTLDSFGVKTNYSAIEIFISNQPKQARSISKNDSVAKLSDSKFKSIMMGIQKSISNSTKKGKDKFSDIKNNKGNITKKITSKTKGFWTSFWSKYINPNPKQAIIVVLITMIIIFFVLFVFSSLNSKPSSVTQIENAQLLISNAQTSLSKNNQASAQESLNKAKESLSKINQSEQQKLNQLAQNKKIKSGYSDTRLSLQNTEDKLTNTVRIEEATSFIVPYKNGLKSIAWLGGSLYGIDTASSNLVEINPLLGSPTVKATNEDLKGLVAMDTFNDTGLIILTKTSIWQFTTDKGLQKINISGLPGAIDIAGYLSNLYLLSPSENQVYRYIKNGLSLSSRASILKNLSSSEISKASSFAVNGNIFIAKGNELLLFEQGSERSYQINNLPNSFGTIKDIAYNKDRGYFILLNEASNRLALLSADPENANFIKMYALNNDSKINSFTIELKNSQILINSGDKIYTNKIEK